MFHSYERNGSTHVRFGPWDIPYKTTNVLCSDGKRRTVWHHGRVADTFWTLPGTVKVHGKTVTGFIWYNDARDAWCFTPNGWLRNADVLPVWTEAN